MLNTRPMAGNVSSSGKERVRQEVEGRRRALTPQAVIEKSGEVEAHLAALPFFSTARTVALYRSQPFEVDTSGLWRRVGDRAVFPRATRRGEPLTWHQVRSPDDFARGVLGLWQPLPQTPQLSPEDIDLWLVPGVAFTPRGDRLGRGAGYYDRALSRARPDALKVGLTFDCCILEALPVESHDVPVDLVVSESGAGRGA